MSYYYKELADCKMDLANLSAMRSDCSRAQRMADELSNSLIGIATGTNSSMLLGDPGGLNSRASELSGRLRDAIQEVQDAVESAISATSGQAEWYEQQNAAEDRRRAEDAARKDGGAFL